MKTYKFILFLSTLALLSGCTEEKTVLKIGDNYQGGLIAYLLQPGDNGYVVGESHGLIVSASNLSDAISWFNGSWTATSANENGLFAGAINTQRIVNFYGSGNYAAKICDDLVVDGYDDWYLPSKYELVILNDNYTLLKFDFNKADTFWSSTELPDLYIDYVWSRRFNINYSIECTKSAKLGVRAVRRF